MSPRTTARPPPDPAHPPTGRSLGRPVRAPRGPGHPLAIASVHSNGTLEVPIRRRLRRPPTPQYDHRINEHIRIQQVRVVDEDGEQLGIMTPDRGRLIARDRGLDLVEVAPNARPPVCRVMDYGKFRYEQSKRKSAQKGHAQQLKIVQLRPKTDTHDLETKLRRAREFLRKGDKVRLVMRLRGRERGLVPRWKAQMRALVDDLGDLARVQGPPQAEGRAVSIMLEPGEVAS